MRGQRVWASVAVAGLVAGLVAIVGAAPASAASTVNITTDCNSDVDLRADVGDTVVIAMTSDCVVNEGVVWNINGLFGSATASGFFGPATAANDWVFFPSSLFVGDWYAYSDGSGTTTITTTLRAADGAGNPLTVGSYLANIGFDGAGPHGIYYAGPRSSGNPIPAWVQAYGRASADATCLDGWNPSWQPWAEKVTGGWVCTRSIPSLG